MSKRIDAKQAAERLLEQRDILIITHKNPDGDAIGSACALHEALKIKGIRSAVINNTPPRELYGYLLDGRCYEPGFEPKFIMAVDTAAENMLGDNLAQYAGKVQLCIDHHPSNSEYADELLLDAGAASCAEIICRVVDAMGVEINPYIADAIYTGAATDTGCFKYSNTTAETHRTAARMMEAGCDYARLNKLLFETRSKGRMKLESMAIDGMEFALNDKIAFVTVTQKMLDETGCDAAAIEGITPLSRMVKGVEAGVTLRQLKNKTWKVSVRTVTIDASKICAAFGGGGHVRASGFESALDEHEIKAKVTELVAQMVNA